MLYYVYENKWMISRNVNINITLWNNKLKNQIARASSSKLFWIQIVWDMANFYIMVTRRGRLGRGRFQSKQSTNLSNTCDRITNKSLRGGSTQPIP